MRNYLALGFILFFLSAKAQATFEQSYLIGQEEAHLPTRGGDAFAAREAKVGPQPTMLGIPTVK